MTRVQAGPVGIAGPLERAGERHSAVIAVRPLRIAPPRALREIVVVVHGQLPARGASAAGGHVRAAGADPVGLRFSHDRPHLLGNDRSPQLRATRGTTASDHAVMGRQSLCSVSPSSLSSYSKRAVSTA